ncbi:MAG: nitroreductase family protein [Methanosarcinales archaeon]|nr:nitroreductase family protein [Methanosarcinales archaeon]
MELEECIKGRRSIRRYRDQPVPRAAVDKLLEAGVYAPSGMNIQPWRFVVIQNKETIQLLSRKTKELLLGMPWPENLLKAFSSEEDTIFYGAPLLILIAVKRIEEWKTVNLLDTGLVAENMFLQAYQDGLGSCFIGFGSVLNQDPQLLAQMGVPEDHELLGCLIFGYPAQSPSTRPREARVLGWIE